MPTIAPTTLRVSGLCRNYGRIRAIEDVSFVASPGQILGLLGPNGAGKSTVMKIVTGFLAADRGTVEFLGDRGNDGAGSERKRQESAPNGPEVHASPIACRELTGWMPEAVPVYEDMQAEAFLRFVGAARGLDSAYTKTRIREVAEGIGLSPMLGRKIRELSRGYRQRVGLAQALLHDPPVIILDEPTSGLDPTQLHGLHEYLRSLARNGGKTVVFSSHILSEVEAIADHLVVIARGSVVFGGSCRDLRLYAAERRMRVRLRLASPSRAPAFVAAVGERLPGWAAETFDDGSMVLIAPLTAGEPVVTESGRVVIDPGALDASAAMAAITDAASKSGAGLAFVDRDLPPLSDAFLSVVSGGGCPHPPALGSGHSSPPALGGGHSCPPTLGGGHSCPPTQDPPTTTKNPNPPSDPSNGGTP